VSNRLVSHYCAAPAEAAAAAATTDHQNRKTKIEIAAGPLHRADQIRQRARLTSRA